MSVKNILSNSLIPKFENLSTNKFAQVESKLNYSDNQAIAQINKQVKTDDKKPQTIEEALDQVLAEQPLAKDGDRDETKVYLELKYPKSPEDMTVADYKKTFLRAEYKQAGYGMLTDNEIGTSEAVLETKGFKREWVNFDKLENLQKWQNNGTKLYTLKGMLERANRGGQAILQHNRAKTSTAETQKAADENEVNQMFVDQARVLWNAGVGLVEDTANGIIDSALTKFGTDPVAMSVPAELRQQVDLSAMKTDYHSMMMRRNLEGIVDGEGIKRGEFTEIGVKIAAPIVVSGVVGGKTSIESLKTLGGIPETEASAVNVATKTSTPKSVTKSGKLEFEPNANLSQAEQKIADKLVAEGNNVKVLKEVENQKGVRTPDFEINGVRTELKTIANLKKIDSDNLSANVSRRILEAGGQASNVILDVSGQTGMTRAIAERAISRAFGNQTFRGSDTIKEVRIYGKDFDITVPFISKK